MDEPNDNLDEVALNALLAEGLDVPTAIEASRRDGGSESATLSWVGVVALLCVAVAVIVLALSF